VCIDVLGKPSDRLKPEKWATGLWPLTSVGTGRHAGAAGDIWPARQESDAEYFIIAAFVPAGAEAQEGVCTDIVSGFTSSPRPAGTDGEVQWGEVHEFSVTASEPRKLIVGLQARYADQVRDKDGLLPSTLCTPGDVTSPLRLAPSRRHA